MSHAGIMAVFGLGIRRAEAHARLVRALPRNGAELTEAPHLLELWFNELLDEGFNTVQLYSAAAKDKKDLLKEKPELDRKDKTHLVVKLPALESGEYRAEYRVLSRDGHTAPGRITFTIVEKSRG